MSKPALIPTFRKLVDDITHLYETARKAQVQFAWETGRRIVEVEQDGAVRAEYGTSLLQQLSDELTRKCGPGFSVSNLRRMRQFYLAQPIQPAPVELNWAQCAELLPVKDAKLRDRLKNRAVKEGLNSKKLRRLVQEATGSGEDKPQKSLPPLKCPTDLLMGTYTKSGRDVDCGFFIYYPADKADLAGITISDNPSYTYAATVERVVDGDTLAVTIEVGFGIKLREKLRLRGINCPELGTPEGEKAKKFVGKLLPAGSRIVLKTSKSGTDKYGRFVADIFYKAGCEGATEIIKRGVYLNQQLLDEGYAVRMI